MHVMEKVEGENETYVTQFILLGFEIHAELQPLLFLLFLVIYIVTMAGNILIIALFVTDQHLHTTMYFFLGNLSYLEISFTSIILPRVLVSLLTGDGNISVTGCITQFYFLSLFVGDECYLLALMSYDWYLAIRKPLHYTALMNVRICLQLAAVSWMSGFMIITIVTCLMSQLHFCDPNEINYFLCDFTPVIKLSCTDTSLITLVTFIFSSIYTLPLFLLTPTSYICIISTILRIPSTTGRRKAFFTCYSHLTVVTIYYGTLIIFYMLPDTDTLRDLNKVFSLFYTVLTSLVNPLIYSLRNKEVKVALRKVISKYMALIEIET
ncbi:olfactory receptor 1020-like [Gopherus flavomarginatus]|uniref:olfactory receptor 1020-like n=1 Tax=Gopherus flavomarginatus TaxID=286002 RepID=UPI0021CC3CCE|nr:olfactory receptor 1020-like [Gopherus flavomarginatus]